jgi:hypothetical protein
MGRRVTCALGMLAIALLSPAPAAGADDLPAERGIVGGAPVGVSAAPWQVALVDTSHYGGPAQFCGGSIVDPTHVVTAAHCLGDPDSWSADEVYAATTKLSEPQQISAVSDRQVHPSYGMPPYANDVAVLTLATPLTLDGTAARAVELASSAPDEGAAVTVSGWGDTSNLQGLYPNQLRAVTVHTVGDTACATAYGGGFSTSVMLCAGEPTGGRDSCAGDSGGPLVNEGTNVLVGIVSFGYQCAQAGYPGIYTEVSATTIRSFVEGVVVSAPVPPAPSDPPAEPDPPSGTHLQGLVLDPGAQPTAETGDTTPPRARVSRSRCSRSSCTLTIHVVDRGVSGGVQGVEVLVRSRRAGLCRLHGGRTPCIRTTATKPLRAVQVGAATYRIRAAHLPPGAINRFSLTAIDAAGNRQASPTVVRIKTRHG